MQTLTSLLALAKAAHAQRVAVSTHGVEMTYGQLFARSRRLARVLVDRGVAPGDRVAILARNGFRYLEANFACVFAGAILAPLNGRLAQAEIDEILRRIDCRLVLGPEALDGVATIGWDDVVGPGGECAYETLLAGAEPLDEAAGSEDPAATAQIFFTSGTTGLPKGVCLAHANLVASAMDAMETLALRQDDVWLHAAPMFHLVDAFAIWGLTLVGGRHVATHFEPEAFGELVEREKITKTSLPPTLLDWIARREPNLSHDLGSLDLISYGGSPMQSSVYERCVATLGCSLLQAYGLTEGSGFVCHEKPGDNPDPNAVINTVGRSTERVALMLRNADGQPSGEGEVGEVLISGQRVFLEYWNDPKATAAAFSGGWYQTGDLAVRDTAGRYRIVGRAKEMIISGGENIYPAEVVNALVSHPAVAEAAVFGAPSERWGEEVRAVVYLVPGDGAAVTAEDLLAYCRTQIAGYKTPKQIELSAAPLPKTGIGKIAVSAVRQAQILKELS